MVAGIKFGFSNNGNSFLQHFGINGTDELGKGFRGGANVQQSPLFSFSYPFSRVAVTLESNHFGVGNVLAEDCCNVLWTESRFAPLLGNKSCSDFLQTCSCNGIQHGNREWRRLTGSHGTEFKLVTGKSHRGCTITISWIARNTREGWNLQIDRIST